MTHYLTVVQVLFLHACILKETGGEPGVLDLNHMRVSISQPQVKINGEEKFPGLLQKAAILYNSLVKSRIFEDANKRTAICAAGIFLKINGQRISASKTEMVRFSRICAESKTSLDHAVAWFWQYSQPASGN